MNETNDLSFDLNLLTTFEALMAERHVTRAAARMGLSQPAMSHALNRLRATLNDEILVRRGTGMEPTPKALALVGPIGDALAQIRETVNATGAFAAESFTGTLHLCVSRYAGIVLLPRLVEAIGTSAPAARLQVSNSVGPAPPPRHISIWLAESESIEPTMMTECLWREHPVCLVRNNHPAIEHGLNKESFRYLDKLFLGIDPENLISAGLTSATERGKTGLFEVDDFLSAAQLLLVSDTVGVVGGRAAERLAAVFPLTILTPPSALPEFGISQAWLRGQDEDPASIWLRNQINRLAVG